jgi:hypothetical protein
MLPPARPALPPLFVQAYALFAVANLMSNKLLMNMLIRLCLRNHLLKNLFGKKAPRFH